MSLAIKIHLTNVYVFFVNSERAVSVTKLGLLSFVVHMGRWLKGEKIGV